PLPPDWIEIEIDPDDHATTGGIAISGDSGWNAVSPEDAEKLLYVGEREYERSEVDWILQRAGECVDVGDLGLALRWANKAIAKDPRGADCWRIRADIHWRAGNLKDADRDFTSAIDLSPAIGADAELCWARRGIIQTLHGNWTDGLTYFESSNGLAA